MVLQRWEACGGISAAQVRKIERVQNLALYSDFECTHEKIAYRRRQQQQRHQPQQLVRSLFHGCDTQTLRTIVNEGFDPRVSNPNGYLGGGTYFALSNAYSDKYASLSPHAYLGSAFAGGGGGGGGSAMSTPSFVPGCRAMLLCDVIVGRSTWAGRPGFLTVSHEYDSASDVMGTIFAVYESGQAYATHVIHYVPAG